jgi:hypothetical protein
LNAHWESLLMGEIKKTILAGVMVLMADVRQALKRFLVRCRAIFHPTSV